MWDEQYKQIRIERSHKVSLISHVVLFHHFDRTNFLNDPRSPSKRQHTYTPCPGCHLNSEEDKTESKLKSAQQMLCGFYVNRNLANVIDVYALPGSNSTHIDRIYLIRSSLYTLSDQTLFVHNKFYQNTSPL